MPASSNEITCPLCGSATEWSIRGAEGMAYCLWSGHAYLEGALAAEYDAGRRCPWTGRIGKIRGEFRAGRRTPDPLFIVRTTTGEGPHLPGVTYGHRGL